MVPARGSKRHPRPASVLENIAQLSIERVLSIATESLEAMDTPQNAAATRGVTLHQLAGNIPSYSVLKQIAPRVLNSIRLNLKAVMLFLFAGEMIASTDGLAYRIALLRRHMGMDVIIPYVLWVALLLFLVDLSMRLINRKLHPWFEEA